MTPEAESLVADAMKWRELAAGRAPSNHRLLAELTTLLRDDASIGERIQQAWGGRRFDVFYERPLLLMAALRFDALRTGPEHPLYRGLGLDPPEPESISRAALSEAFASEGVWRAITTRFVQTNETSRAIAWLYPAALAGCNEGRSLALFEIGSSAGLNLVADRLPSIWSALDGGPFEIARTPTITARVGMDLRPLDVRDDDCVTWMRACIWAGDTERLARFDAAVRAFHDDPPDLLAADAIDAPTVIERAPDADCVLAFQTIVRDYFSPDTNRAYESNMRDWLARRPRGGALWCELELDHEAMDRKRPAVLTAHAPDGHGAVHDFRLARANYHPRELIVDRAAVAAFVAMTR